MGVRQGLEGSPPTGPELPHQGREGAPWESLVQPQFGLTGNKGLPLAWRYLEYKIPKSSPSEYERLWGLGAHHKTSKMRVQRLITQNQN